MEKSRSSKPLKMHQIQQLPEHQMCAAGQSVASQSARPLFQDRGRDSLDQVWYTWHQRRRLKELKIRYLSRKFFHLWAKKTFGQVLPSKARYFYVQKILQKTFGEWKEWWTDCRERKLSLKAASYYRHFLLNLIFKAWRAYVCQQQGKRNKYYFAESHAKKQKLLRTWQHWLVYVDVQRTKHGMQSVALSFRERSCLRTSWTMWRRQHYQNHTRHKMNILALQYWAQSLQFRAWLQWRALYLYSQNEKQKETRAVTHRQHWKLKKCMEAWLSYLSLHRAKKIQNELAQEHHQSRIVRQCFSDWHVSWECRRRMHAHREDMEKLSARIALWRAFAHWKHYVLCVEETRRRELAEKHYKRYLLKLGFKGLCQNVLNSRLQQMRKNLSYRQHEVTVLHKFWNHWKYHLEEKEEEQQQALTSVAHAHYRRVLMRQVFDTWLLNTHKQQEYRIGEKKAVMHFERQLLHCSWCFWCSRTAACLKEQEGLACAREHYSNLLLLKAFSLWKQNTLERKTERLKERQAVRFHYSKHLRQTWNKWREHMEHQHEKWRQLVQADLHYQHTLLGKTLGAWKTYQHNIQCIQYQVAEKEKEHMRLLLRQLLCTWRENALALICEAKVTTRADEHYRRAVLSKVLLQWRYAALLQVCCRQWKVTAVMEARKHLDIVCLQTLFLQWKELTRESLMLRTQQHRAVQHHQQHLIQKYLVKWKKYHQHCLGKMLLQRQGNQLMTHRLCSASFSCWKTRLLQQWEKQKTVQALWHWSVSLQRKVFSAWLRFAKEQQQKKDPIEKAKGIYHTNLLREGLAGVSRYTTDIKQLQGHLQVQHQLKVKENKVTFEMPDVSSETRGHSAEEELWPSKCSGLPFHLACGDSVLGYLNTIQQARLPSQRPDFLLESPESKELLGPFTRSDAPFQQTSLKRCSAQIRNLMPTRQVEKNTCKCLSQMSNTTHCCPSLTHAAFPSVPQQAHGVHCAVQRPELWYPSSFMPQMKAGAEMRGGQPVSGHKGAHSQDSQEDTAEKRLQPNLQPHLLSPEDLVGKWSYQTAAEVEKREQGSRESTVFQRKLEAELRHIQQQMQYYYSRKQELRCCLQQAEILQKWLEMGMQDGVQGVQEQLDQLQARISALTEAQPKERRCVQNLVARLHDLQIALGV